jgi:hypothetical protein
MPNKDEEAVALAQTHYKVEAGLTHVFRIGVSDRSAQSNDEARWTKTRHLRVPLGGWG